MKKIYVILILLGAVVSSCLKDGLEDLPAYDLTKITSFNLEYRFEAKNANGVSYVEVVTLPTTVVIDSESNKVTVTPSLPAANSVFTVAERSKVSLKKIIGYCSLETAASIKPIGDSPKLGVPGDWTVERKYLVTAADGKTTREWTIKVNPLPVIN
jgi:hypothetical protein